MKGGQKGKAKAASSTPICRDTLTSLHFGTAEGSRAFLEKLPQEAFWWVQQEGRPVRASLRAVCGLRGALTGLQAGISNAQGTSAL